MQTYKEFKSAEFVDRDDEFNSVQLILKERNRGVIIFEGERGSGKTSLLLELFRRFHEQTELRPFLISLFPYSAPEFESKRNLWISSERAFQANNIPDVMGQLAHYLEIDFIESKDPNIQKEYLARGLAYRTSKTVPVLLMDSIYECPDAVRIEIEKYVLGPILASERVFVILSGRGKRPVWSRPELQTAEIIDLPPLKTEYVKEQLEKMGSKRVREYQEIADLSQGYPLIVRVMGDSEKALPDALSDAIDIIIRDTLPERLGEDEKYDKLRTQIEKLSLVNIPFRVADVEDYLYSNDSEQRFKTNNLVSLLLESRILRYQGKGYKLNESIVYPLRKWLIRIQKAEYQINLTQLRRVRMKLQQDYPSAESWYERMVPEELPTNNKSNLSTNHKARLTS